MCPASRLRVLVDRGDDELLRWLADLVEIVDAPPADVALVVLESGKTDAISALRERSGAPVVAVVDGAPSMRPARALAASADGVVEHARIERVLIPTLHAVAVGQAVFPAPLQRALEHPALSNREKQILAMVVLGCSNAAIAAKLVVTESTVKNHLCSAFTKLGVSSRNAATSLIPIRPQVSGWASCGISVADEWPT